MAKIGKIIGTDISKSTFSVAYRKGTSVETRTWDYTQEQMAAFAETLDEGSTVVMEATGVYHTRIAYYLYHKGIGVSVVNPLAARNRMEALSHSVIASGVCMKMVKADIKRLERDIACLEKEIERLVKDKAGDDMKRIEEIPGIGRRTACVLIALTRSMKSFDNHRQVASYLGLCPRVYESGTSIRGKAKICKMGLESVRRMLYLCALSAMKYNKACRELYERLLEKGKAKKLALVAVANKLIKQAFAILRSGMN